MRDTMGHNCIFTLKCMLCFFSELKFQFVCRRSKKWLHNSDSTITPIPRVLQVVLLNKKKLTEPRRPQIDCEKRRRDRTKVYQRI